MTALNHIEGIFHLTSPLHCAAKSNGGLTSIMRMPLITRTSRTTIPYFPGNDLRGRIRRIAAGIILDHLGSLGLISRELYSGLTSGSAFAAPEGSSSVEEIMRGRANVFMGLFGGAARMLHSQFDVNDLIPVLADTIAAGLVPESLTADGAVAFVPQIMTDQGAIPAQGYHLIHEFQFIRKDDVYDVLQPDSLAKLIDGGIESIATYQANCASADKARKGDESGDTKKTTLKNMMTIEAIAPGTPMHCRIDFEDSLSNAQLGLLLHSLCGVINAQNIGGWHRAGMGHFKPVLTLIRDGEPIEFLGQDSHGRYVLNNLTEMAYGDPMRAEISELTHDGLLDFYLMRNKKESVEEKAPKAEKVRKSA
jgi:CRISPR type IV-associated protein Csf2